MGLTPGTPEDEERVRQKVNPPAGRWVAGDEDDMVSRMNLSRVKAAIGRILRLPEAPPRPFDRADGYNALLVASAHLLMSIFYVAVIGISITADPEHCTWDWFWQSVPVALLRTDLMRSIWFLHSQPPLYNLLGGVLAKVFSTHQLQALHAGNILLGSVLSGMLYLIIVQLIPSRKIALGFAFVLAMNPSLYLYEAYTLYDLLSAFLVVLSVFCLSWHRAAKSTAALYCFLASFNVLILTRSVYQAVLLPIALILAVVLAEPDKRKRVLVIGSAICMLSLGWCGKNYAMFGFFGTSSWSGLGLWRIASRGYSASELEGLSDRGLLDRMVVERKPFMKPSAYRRYGFDKSSNIAVLSRDDLNNINVPDISREYGKNAVRLILNRPGRYVRSVYLAYLIFCRPSSRFGHVQIRFNANKIRFHEGFYSDVLQGRSLMSRGKTYYGSFLFFLLPCALALYGLQLLLRIRAHRSLGSLIQDDAVMLWCSVLIIYTTLTSCLTVYTEQERYKFLIEQIVWIFIPVVLLRGTAWLNRANAGNGKVVG